MSKLKKYLVFEIRFCLFNQKKINVKIFSNLIFEIETNYFFINLFLNSIKFLL